MTPIELDDFDRELDELERLSNSVLDHIDAKDFEAARQACLELGRRFPDQIDWVDRTARLHEARGEVDLAILHFRRCLDFVDLHPDDFDEESRESYREEIERLILRP